MKIEQITENGITYEVRFSANGTKRWLLNNQTHRENGPAYERSNGYKEWWLNGSFHRENGYAIEPVANLGSHFWLGNEYFTKQEYFQLVRKINKFYNSCSVGDILSSGLILLGKRNPPVGKIFKVYDIKERKIYEKLVFDFIR